MILDSYDNQGPSDFVIFKKFPNKHSAQELADLLSQNGIPYLLEDSSLAFEMANHANELSQEYRIKLRKEHFEKAQELMDQHAAAQLHDIDPEYPLLSFTDDELRDVLMKPDEWNAFDYVLAQKVLKDRGKGITAEEIKYLKEQRLQELAKPDDGQRWWIIFAYLIALFGGLFGILIGVVLSSHKKTLPNGDRVYAYSTSTRAHGQYIAILGIFVMAVSILVKIIYFSTFKVAL